MNSDYAELFDIVPEALLVVDAAGAIVRVNRQAESLFGYAARELEGQAIEMLMPEAARSRHRVHRARYMAAPRVRPMGSTGMTLVGRRRDGTAFPVEIALGPMRAGMDVRYLASVRDISESQRVRQELVRARYDALVATIGQQALEAANEERLLAELPERIAATLGIEQLAIVLTGGDRQSSIRAFNAAGDAFQPPSPEVLEALISTRHIQVIDNIEAADKPPQLWIAMSL